MLHSSRRHYPEYMIEAVLVGLFAVSICGGVGAIRYHTAPILGLPPLALRLILGIILAVYVTLETPLSGTSMNPARSFGTAVWANVFQSLWVCFSAPVIGMLLAIKNVLLGVRR